jgi:hypothetical protein
MTKRAYSPPTLTRIEPTDLCQCGHAFRVHAVTWSHSLLGLNRVDVLGCLAEAQLDGLALCTCERFRLGSSRNG